MLYIACHAIYCGEYPVKRLLITLLLLPVMAGCSIYSASDQSEADKLVTRYHQAFKAGDWDTLLSLYSPAFFKAQSNDEWRHKLMGLHSQYGALKEVRRSYAQKDSRYRGDYYIYGYRLIFAKGAVNETITIFKGIENDKLTIAGHVFKAGQGA